ncbi:Rab geranylgeranyl transferase escort protein, putative [Talaromyces stipitatus ATCC 10500]|uniref:Rab proteins geranylgeranyltransferase n=1 Tax=Talaromyces stipitatus (strain ATCC 10500 / CBS 375.48 / QM 6759 / NRRL 1006) TaxID=441959 RepID=B8M4T3_TALSN|nr:Rab geranylgeranyl transferase escort protein, putative [Talaromyces stipitatus ATCC 10500]EED19368.1 Rab geranylgeranyl transferase escort protein, putative [Talaromyces stipitatus ATCC 10500]
MESLTETPWDVTISGTGLAQSLLALALSRSGKKVLHVDKNIYYGGPEAAFSVQEAQEWVDLLQKEPGREPFEDVSIYAPSNASDDGKKLSFSRAYTLSLSPQLVYTRSKLLPTLVSSRVYRQLEFQAVGSWWIYGNSGAADDDASRKLRRVPSSREDIFADDMISMKAKRMLIRFLRNVNQPQQTETDDEQSATDEGNSSLSLSKYLNTKFNAPSELHNPIHSLSLCQQSPEHTPTDIALPRIKRHLGSLGVFGPGFGSLVAKWGGGAEIAQVGCRALAVGGGVYVLGRGIDSVDTSKDDQGFYQLTLSSGEHIRSKYIAGSLWDLPQDAGGPSISTEKVARSISIVSSPLKRLFPITAEGGPIPAGAVVLVPGEVLPDGTSNHAPVYLLVHSSETGECPDGQCVIYGSISVSGQEGQHLLEIAINRLLDSFIEETDKPAVLWSLRFTQIGTLDSTQGSPVLYKSTKSDQILYFAPPSLDLAFDDRVVESVRECWKAILDEEAQDDMFMKFEDRETYDDDYV